ncbi:Ig-like domain-containing protein [Isoptericola croceus]|uniref:Ig-like domain-containing protein n=1 Tax=Isoptericola croceus TaxID=3031406 RepID=UPI0023F7270D|nr:Ig-like domain-containing protein [Isoptericola croceus]
MRLFASVRDDRRRAAATVVVAVVSVAVVGTAVLHDGQATADVDLDDAGVWVTNASSGQVGRFNTAAQEIDGTLLAGSTVFDVEQQGNDVLVVDDGSSAASGVDVARMRLAATTGFPAGAQVTQGGGVVAILDTVDGLLWTMPSADLPSFDPEEVGPVAEVGSDARVVASPLGDVHAVAPTSDTLWSVKPGTGEASETRLGLLSAGDEVEVTTVGQEPVVLVRSSGQLRLPGGDVVEVPDASGARLQQPGADADAVSYATSAALVAQPLDGGEPVTRPASGVPASPVHVAGCVYGAWGSSGQVIRNCPGDGDDIDMRLDGFDPQARLVYRVNRNAVVLNELSSGTLWMALEDFRKVDQWEITLPEDADGEGDGESDTPEQVDRTVLERDRANRPPKANDDEFGVRPGSTTVLDVLADDVDPDGDVLTARVSGDGPEGMPVTEVLGGKALQVEVPEDARGGVAFEYEVADGRRGVDDAQVRLSVVPWDENSDPEQVGEPVLRVQRGAVNEIKVLPSFRDPDGDDLYLAGADATAEGDWIRHFPDGTVEYRASGSTTGRKKVNLVIADGQGGVTDGVLWVEVIEAQEPPVAVGVHARVTVGETVTVEPLSNDYDPNGDDLRLAAVSEAEPAEIVPNYGNGTLTFRSDEPGSYDVLYEVSDGPSSTTGVIRVDVIPEHGDGGPPVAVADIANLPAGGSTLVDVLANDADPAGRVLVVQSVEVPDDAGVSVAVLGHSILRITEVRAFAEPVTFTYTVSNGSETATGEVRILPIPAPDRIQPPRANLDEVTVRVGDIVTVDVLHNDVHPDGLELELVEQLAELPHLGEAFVSERAVRFRAGFEAGTTHLVYKVRDEHGQEDSAQVTVNIRDQEDNLAPVPRDLEARLLTGTVARIPVPLDVDPDGDSVILTGIAEHPVHGVVRIEDGDIVYEASRVAVGTDTLRYTVQDTWGATGTASVRIGIAEPPPTNQPPVAVNDHVMVQPGREVLVPVLRNDFDPDGDPIGLVDGATQGGEELQPTIQSTGIAVAAPEREGSYSFYYAIEDTYSARASAAVTVEVRHDAPLRPPVARDDVLPLEEVEGLDSIGVDVLANDEDPDGSVNALEITSDDDVEVTDDGQVVIPVDGRRTIVKYTVTDPDGLTGQAFVVVPGRLDLLGDPADAPHLRDGLTPIEVVAGEPFTVELADHVVVAEGRTPRLTDAETVVPVEGVVTVPGSTGFTYTPHEEYHGPAAVSFQVSDGGTDEFPDGKDASLQLPFMVVPPENLPPEPGQPTAEVAAGEESTVDLERFASDPEGEPLTFAVGAAPEGLTVTQDDAGGRVTLQAAPDVEKGSAFTVPYTVSDGVNEPVDGSLAIKVAASTRPLAVAAPDAVDDVHQGSSVLVPVLENDTNPFEGIGPLRVIDAVVETGDGTVEVHRHDAVAVTPASDFVGTMVVVYRIEDATEDFDRHVEGRVTVNVLGVPRAPARPLVEEVRSRTVVLSWNPPGNNGSPITSYTVTSSAGDVFECATTTCTLEGLTNDVTYTFTVAAHNAVGRSEASSASEEARPDQRPDPPAAPALDWADGEIVVEWENSVYDDRSPITSVDLEISGATASGATQQRGVTGNRLVWDGLSNGTEYKVRVRAHNAAPEPSEWGPWSTGAIPAGAPSAPAAPTVSRGALGDSVPMTVSWKAPSTNGRPITEYTVETFRGSTSAGKTTVAASSTSTVIDARASDDDYTFRVMAHNAASERYGGATWSDRSAPVRAFTPPSEVSSLSAEATGRDGEIILTRGTASAKGADRMTYQYRTGSSGSWTAMPDRSATIRSLSNGSSYRPQVRAVSHVGSDSSNGPARTLGTAVVPYGPQSAPGVKATGNRRSVTLSWTDPGGNGRPYHVEIRVDGGAWEKVSKSGSRTVGNGPDSTHQIRARAVPTEGSNAASAVVSATSDTTTTKVRKGGGAPSGNYLRLTVDNGPANASFRVACYTSRDGQFSDSPWSHRSFRTNASGDFVGDLPCYWGFGGYQVWVKTDHHKIPDTPKYTW